MGVVTISLADLKLEAEVIIRDGVFMAARSVINYYGVTERQVCCILLTSSQKYFSVPAG